MKVVYIAHPIGGNVECNLANLRQVARCINLTNPDVVPFVPYYIDVVSMDDNIPRERERGIKNGLELISRKGVVDEMWLYGSTITAGMRKEIIAALKMKIPIVASTSELHTELKVIKSNYERFGN